MAYANLGCILCDNLRDYENAAACFRKVIELDPNNANAHCNLGNALRGLKKFDEAIAAYRQAIELDPHYPNSHFQLGMTLCNQLHQYDNAIACFTKAVEIDSRNVAYQVQLGYALGLHGKPDEAIAAYRKVIELEPNSKRAADAFFRIGKALEVQGKLGETITSFEKAVELDPKWAVAQNALAWLLTNCRDAKLRDPKRGLEVARKAVELAPQSSFTWQLLGWAQYRAGDWKAGVEALEKSCALQNNPKGGDAYQWFFLAMSHWQLGEKDKARQWYDRAVQWMDKNQPKNEDLRRFRAEAEELMKEESSSTLMCRC
jgi:tetratricopeptide (TPR) repeat protein